MRPLEPKKFLAPGAVVANLDALLMNEYGPYCAVSEQPLVAESYVWSKRIGDEVGRGASLRDWPDVLLLSCDCYRAQVDKAIPPLRLPDGADPTFRLAADSYYRYVRREVRLVVDDDEGEEVRDPEPMVIVEADEQEAVNTIDYFELNTRYYDAGEDALRIPRVELNAGYGRFVWQRARAWQLAVELARAVFNVIDDDVAREVLIRQGQRLIGATGYWSTWATALAEQKIPRDFIEQLLTPKADSRGIHGHSPENPFPGTRGGTLGQ